MNDNGDMKISELQYNCHENAMNHGWYKNPVNIPEKLALIHSEVSEALEDFRDGKMELYISNGKPCGFPVELADIVIRCLDLAGYLAIDLESMIDLKMAYNETRPYRHGDKAA